MDATRVVVSVADDSGPDLDELTRRLRDELRDLDLSIVDAPAAEAPEGSKAIELAAIGAFVVALSQSAVLAALVHAVSDWLGRRQQRSVTLDVDGDVLELSGAPSPEQDRLVEAWLRRRDVKRGTTLGRRFALIVANDDYTDPGLRRLRAPAHDAERLAAVLRAPAIGGFDVRALRNESAPTINEAVEEFFADRDPHDLLLLYFSGHGVKDQDGELHFAAAPTKLNRLGATAVAADFVNRRMNRSQSRRIVLLLDCCYAGAFGRGMVARAGSDVALEAQFGGRGRAVLTASSAMEYAFEGAELSDASAGGPSVFTSALVEGLETGDADRDQDGYVGLDELYDFVYDRVRARTPHQTPGKWVFDLRGDLYLARRGRPVTTPAPLPRDLQDAVEHPLSGIRVGAVSELKRLLDNRHAGLALAARLALERMVEDDSRSVSAAATAALGPAVREVGTTPVLPASSTPPSGSRRRAPGVGATPVLDVEPAPTVPRPRADQAPVLPSAAAMSAAATSTSAATPAIAGTSTTAGTPPIAGAPPAEGPEDPAPAAPIGAAAGPRFLTLDSAVRGLAGLAAVLLVAAYPMRLGVPASARLSWAQTMYEAATIWLFLLIAAALVLAVRPPGRAERDAAAGGALGLAAGLLGLMQAGLVGLRSSYPYGAGFWIAAAGIFAILVAAAVELARDRPRWIVVGYVAAAVLAIAGLAAFLVFPEDLADIVEDVEAATYVIYPAVGLLAVLALLGLARRLWTGPRLPAALGLACVALLATDAVLTLVSVRTPYAPVLVILLLVLTIVDDDRPTVAFAARTTLVLILLLKVPSPHAMIHLSSWLVVLEIAAALTAAGALYLSRNRLSR